jgi:hypothetical protein
LKNKQFGIFLVGASLRSFSNSFVVVVCILACSAAVDNFAEAMIDRRSGGNCGNLTEWSLQKTYPEKLYTILPAHFYSNVLFLI